MTEPSFAATRRIGENWLGADSPSRRSEHSSWRAYAWAIVTVIACTLIDHLILRLTPESNLIMVYLLGNVAVALRGNRWAALLAAILSVGAYDFFFVHPYLTFAVADTQYLFTFFVMGLVGTVISTLTARLVAELSATRQRERRALALNALSHSLLTADAPAEMLEEAARLIGHDLGLTVGAWLNGEQEGPIVAVPPPSSLTRSEVEILRAVLKEGMAAGPGTTNLPGSGYLFLPVRSAQRIHGAIGIPIPEGTQLLLPEVRSALETVANQLAIAMAQAQARAEADEAKRKAESEQLRSALLSSVSHDLRTPLTGIVGSAGTLVEGAEALDPHIRRELAQSIVEEAERLSRLVKNLLQATRLEAGSVQLMRTCFPLEEALSPALARLQPMLEGHPVEVDLAPDLPFVDGDPVLIEQVFGNLLENAAKYTSAGTPIRIEASMAGELLWVSVCDRGPGLPSGEEERVFEKFHRHPVPGGRSGAGLGLSICRGIIEAHGGTIKAFNRTGGGACFRFSLAIAPAHGKMPHPPHEVT